MAYRLPAKTTNGVQGYICGMGSHVLLQVEHSLTVNQCNFLVLQHLVYIFKLLGYEIPWGYLCWISRHSLWWLGLVETTYNEGPHAVHNIVRSTLPWCNGSLSKCEVGFPFLTERQECFTLVYQISFSSQVGMGPSCDRRAGQDTLKPDTGFVHMTADVGSICLTGMSDQLCSGAAELFHCILESSLQAPVRLCCYPPWSLFTIWSSVATGCPLWHASSRNLSSFEFLKPITSDVIL